MNIIGSRLDCRSGAELKVYDSLKSADIKDWTAIFNLSRLGEHWESDIILIGTKGIIVIEVKGGEVYRESDGFWYSDDFYGETHPIKNPIIQAKDAMHNIRRLIDKTAQIPKGLYFEAAILPGTDLSGQKNDELFLVLDKHFLKQPKIELEILVKSLRANYPNNFLLSHETIMTVIEKVLAPKLGITHNLANSLNDNEDEFISLNNEQYEMFEGLLNNQKIVVRGPAGSGKTILALKVALSNEQKGIRTLLVCYNQALAGYLQSAFQLMHASPKYVSIANINNYMGDYLDASQFKTEIGTKERSEAFWNKVIEDGNYKPYKELIIDEAQDIFTATYIDVLDIIVDGGLTNGRWLAFLDPEQAGIYEPVVTKFDLHTILSNYGNYVDYSLSRNMRNTKEIADWTKIISGISPGKASKVSGHKPEVIDYIDRDQASKLVPERIEKLLNNDGFRPSEISIVSPLSLSKSLASTGRINSDKFDLEAIVEIEWDNLNPRAISYGTARNYKGLENRVIIVTDLDNLRMDDLNDTLNYI